MIPLNLLNRLNLRVNLQLSLGFYRGLNVQLRLFRKFTSAGPGTYTEDDVAQICKPVQPTPVPTKAKTKDAPRSRNPNNQEAPDEQTDSLHELNLTSASFIKLLEESMAKKSKSRFLQVWDRIKTVKSITNSCFNTVLVCSKFFKEPSVVEEVLEQMANCKRKVTIEILNLVIDSYVACGESQKANALFSMAKSEMGFNTETFKLAFRFYDSDAERYIELFQDLETAVCEKNLSIDLQLFAILFTRFVKVEEHALIEKLFVLAKHSDLHYDIAAYNSIIYYYGLVRVDLGTMNLVLSKMIKQDLKANSRTLTILYHAYRKAGDTAKVQQVLEEMKMLNMQLPVADGQINTS